MKIPKKIKIKGKTWRIRLVPSIIEDDEECQGLCNFDDRLILINKKLSEAQTKFVLFHEVFHALLHEAHVPRNVRFSEALEEVICDSFADLLTSTFKNTELKRTR
jgi:Zn-dependent peptidase ImmA (M78 family)